MSASVSNSPMAATATPSSTRTISSEDSLQITIQPTIPNADNSPLIDDGQRSPKVLSKSQSQTVPIILGSDGSSTIGGHSLISNRSTTSKQSVAVPPTSAVALPQPNSLQVPINPNDLKSRSLMELPQVIRETGMLRTYVNYPAMGTARKKRLNNERGLRKRVHLHKEHAIKDCYARVQDRFKRIRRDLRFYATDRVDIAQIRHFLKMVYERDYAECDALLLQGTKNIIQLQEPTTGNTVLHTAALINDVNMMTFLLRKGAVPNARNRRGLTPAMIAAQHGFIDMIELLAMAQADFNVKDNAGRNVLYFCLQPTERHLKCLQRCVDFDADVNCCDAGGNPLLFEACEIADIIPDICVELIDSGASAGVEGSHRTTLRAPLNAACRAGCVRVCKALLENGANPNAGDQHSVMPVHEAAYVGSLPCLQLLSAYGANFSAQAEDGNTPLHIAVFEGHTTVCRFLVSRGCDASLKNVERFAPQQIAKFFNQKPSIKEIRKGAKAVKALRTNNQMWKVRFYDWVSANDVALQQAFKNIVATKTQQSDSPGSAGAVKTLLNTTIAAVNKIDVEDFVQVLQNLNVPLITDEQRQEICTLFTDPGSAPAKIDLIQFAKAVKYLPKPAQTAAFYPKVKKQKLAKALPNPASKILPVCSNAQPNYPVALKYKSGPIVPVVKRLVDFTRFTRDNLPDLLRDDVFWYADVPPTMYAHLTEAARFGDLETLAEAVENKIDLDQVDKYFRSPLIAAAAAGLLQTVMFLVKHGAHVDWPRDGFKWTALHHACRAGHLDVAQYLVSQGADVKSETINNCTPLMKAIEGGRYDCVTYLLSFGSAEAVNHTNREGLSAARYAECFGNLSILELVESYQVKALEVEMARNAKNNNNKKGTSSGGARSTDGGGRKAGAGGEANVSNVNQLKADKDAANRIAPDAARYAAATAAVVRVSSSQVGVPLRSISTRDVLAMQPSEFGGDDDGEMLINSHPQKFPLRDPFHTSNPEESYGVIDENETLVFQAATLLEKDLERNGDTTFYTAQGVVKPHLKGAEELIQDRAHRRVLDGVHVDFVDSKKTYVNNMQEKIEQNLPLIQQAGLSFNLKK